jgi:TRAP-type C4-dicarboxylate transport system substrate-binding protein
MQTRRITQWAAVTVLAGLALALAACSGSSSDKAGGDEERPPVVLKLASITDDIQPPLRVFAEEVARRSGGTLRIEFEPAWRPGDPNAERGTIEDVKAGKADMAWVGARVFDTLDMTSFQALLAPLLVDSYDLEGRVFESGIPMGMLEGVEELGVVGIGVLPGQMRRLLGVSHPFLQPSDFEGQVIGGAENELSVRTLQALGATLEALPAGGSLGGLDATEQHLAAIWGNRYDKDAEYVTANLNLWPRPLVIFADKEVFASLTSKQQAVLREAASAAIPGALAASRAEDEEAALLLCRRGMTFAVASESELAELRGALEPVYAELTADPETKSYIDAITDLKTEAAASAEATACTSTGPPTTASPIPDGTYETTLTKADWLKGGVSEEEASRSAGVYSMIFDAGELTILTPDGEPGFEASYTLFRDQIEAHENEGYTVTARWSFDDKTLTFTDIRVPGGDATPETVTWASHPWVKVETPIDGVYEFTTTVKDLSAAGGEATAADVENYGKFRWVLDGGRFEMTQKNGASDRWTKGTYGVRDDVVEFTVEEFGGAAPNGAHEQTGEVFTYTWSLYRDQLILGPVEGASSPENFLAKPWERVN